MVKARVIAMSLLLLTGCAGSPSSPQAQQNAGMSPSVSSPPGVPRLPYGIYEGVVVKIDPATRVMTYRVTDACQAPKVGTFEVPLAGAKFSVHLTPRPEQGSTDDYSFRDWVAVTQQPRFKDWEVRYSASYVSIGNGPSAWCDEPL